MLNFVSGLFLGWFLFSFFANVALWHVSAYIVLHHQVAGYCHAVSDSQWPPERRVEQNVATARMQS